LSGQRFLVDEQEMKLLRDKALFSDSEYARFKAVKEMSKYGINAIPLIMEIAENSNGALNRLCKESIEQIQFGI
jgi:hypothetical protein